MLLCRAEVEQGAENAEGGTFVGGGPAGEEREHEPGFRNIGERAVAVEALLVPEEERIEPAGRGDAVALPEIPVFPADDIVGHRLRVGGRARAVAVGCDGGDDLFEPCVLLQRVVAGRRDPEVPEVGEESIFVRGGLLLQKFRETVERFHILCPGADFRAGTDEPERGEIVVGARVAVGVGVIRLAGFAAEDAEQHVGRGFLFRDLGVGQRGQNLKGNRRFFAVLLSYGAVDAEEREESVACFDVSAAGSVPFQFEVHEALRRVFRLLRGHFAGERAVHAADAEDFLVRDAADDLPEPGRIDDGHGFDFLSLGGHERSAGHRRLRDRSLARNVFLSGVVDIEVAAPLFALLGAVLHEGAFQEVLDGLLNVDLRRPCLRVGIRDLGIAEPVREDAEDVGVAGGPFESVAVF